jgi:hypothetical protein
MSESYKSKYNKISGNNYSEKERKARSIYNAFSKSTKRQPYIRSAYFNKEKVFLRLFWEHLAQKRRAERERRIVFYNAALDLIRNSRVKPETL